MKKSSNLISNFRQPLQKTLSQTKGYPIPTSRTPTQPGEMLVAEFLIPMQITQQQLAEAIHVSTRHVNAIISGRKRITPFTASRLAKFLGTSAEFWLNLQIHRDVYLAKANDLEVLKDNQLHVNR